MFTMVCIFYVFLIVSGWGLWLYQTSDVHTDNNKKIDWGLVRLPEEATDQVCYIRQLCPCIVAGISKCCPCNPTCSTVCLLPRGPESTAVLWLCFAMLPFTTTMRACRCTTGLFTMFTTVVCGCLNMLTFAIFTASKEQKMMSLIFHQCRSVTSRCPPLVTPHPRGLRVLFCFVFSSCSLDVIIETIICDSRSGTNNQATVIDTVVTFLLFVFGRQ